MFLKAIDDILKFPQSEDNQFTVREEKRNQEIFLINYCNNLLLMCLQLTDNSLLGYYRCKKHLKPLVIL